MYLFPPLSSHRMIEIHSHAVRRRYYAGCCSCAVLVQAVVLAVLVVIPFIIAFHTQGLCRNGHFIASSLNSPTPGFWVEERAYSEQPRVSYQHTGIIIVESAAASHVWSSFPKYNSLIQSAAASPLIQVSVH